MGKLICEICGSEEILKEDGYFRCGKCGVCYTSDQLKKMLGDTPDNEENNKHTTTKTLTTKYSVEKFREKIIQFLPKLKKTLPPFIGIAFAALCVILIFHQTLISAGVISDKSRAKGIVEDFLERNVLGENLTMGEIHFDSVEAVRFKTRDEDPVGYFPKMDSPVIVQNEDGTKTEYESNFDYSNRGNMTGYDPEADIKWAYTLSGTYDVTHKIYGSSKGEFCVVFVHNLSQNVWHEISREYGPAVSTLRQQVTNQLKEYMLATYDIKPNISVKITSLEDSGNSYYTVYGYVSVRDKYGEEHSVKFDGEYYRNNADHRFEQKHLQVEKFSGSLLP